MTRVAAVTTALYGVPNEEALADATQSFDELELVVVEVELEDGTEGLGFTYTIGEGGAAIKTFVESTLEPVLVGGPAAPRVARDRCRAATTYVGREGISELAISAVDIALWDALGRRCDAPLYELIGGQRGRVPAYQTHGGWLHFEKAELVENAHETAERGFAGMKMKIGRGHAADAARIRAVREALPDDMDLMVDANCAFTVPEARRFARHLGDVPLDWLEEPLDKGDMAGHADLRARIDVPIAMGENLFNERQFKQAIAADAADVLQPDVCRVGGITAWLAVADTARTWGLPISPHYVEPLHIHLATAFDNVPYIENHSTILDSVLESPPAFEDGAFVPPERAGHGIRFAGLDAHKKVVQEK
ncbi:MULTISPECIES: mandelate racemase/muconate lactonizing enzyme family protein [unclassified Haladaptatus]|uniref:mandelate racemase/muconate lactonizing enzyme family protein n=1 Tax=unclassified Haladaptatus TaxID=2622732 RepID=UPI0023E8DECE|nr:MULTISPECIES: mandelate racemase/muconate lactonizing enzyme family protein [unclassified Haladaptatus]